MDRKKYIVEASDDVKKVIAMGVTRGGAIWTDTTDIENLEELNSDYINEHFGDLQDTAYQRGLEDGKKATWGLVADASSAEYQRGLDDAWEAARKISLMPPDEIEKVFPGAAKYNRYNLGYSGTEAIEKLKAYEEKQKADDEIKVGDEVEVKERGIKFFVTKIYEEDGTVGGLNKDGGVRYWSLNLVKRTGRHFDIDKILEEMKE